MDLLVIFHLGYVKIIKEGVLNSLDIDPKLYIEMEICECGKFYCGNIINWALA